MVCIGPGPGPKNVLVEEPDGRRVVVPYAIWKHAYKKETDIADEFRTVTGIVQFPPRDGNANGKAVRNITIRQTGFGPTAVRVNATLWPSHAHVAVAEGDVVMVDGKYNQTKRTNEESGETKTYHNLSVTRIAVLGKSDGGKKAEVENETEDVVDEDIPF